MEEMKNNVPWQPYQGEYAPPPAPFPPQPEKSFLPAGEKERVFGFFAIICGMLLCNFTLFGGFNLGFSLAVILCLVCSAGYLMASGCRLTVYSGALLTLSAVIAAAFGRSDDGFVKFVMVCFLLISVNLGLCLLAGQNRRNSAGVTSLLDAPRALFVLGVGKIAPAFRGLGKARSKIGSASKRGGAVLLGLVVAVPVLGILISLLVSADAAFEALISYLPDFDFDEIIATLIFGANAACVLYTRAAALRHAPKESPAGNAVKRTLNHLTVNTVLGAVALVYLVYLLSQLAYFSGGFSGILPEEYTMAEYARRGFFEMAWLCAIDLGIIALAVAIVAKENGKAPLSTRLLCLFIGLVTVFLVAAASAKMFMYIGSYGLTRLRVLTEVVMVFLGLATALVSVWLFAPKLQYMKVLMIMALVIGAAVIWVDVDTVVASYNVSAYQDGRLAEIDLEYLEDLGSGVIPQIARLTEDADSEVAEQARQILEDAYVDWNDFRGWNYADWRAKKLSAEGYIASAADQQSF